MSVVTNSRETTELLATHSQMESDLVWEVRLFKRLDLTRLHTALLSSARKSHNLKIARFHYPYSFDERLRLMRRKIHLRLNCRDGPPANAGAGHEHSIMHETITPYFQVISLVFYKG